MALASGPKLATILLVGLLQFNSAEAQSVGDMYKNANFGS